MFNDNRADLFKRVETALNTMRPYLAADGGDVKIIAITEEGRVQLQLLGNCQGCSMSSMTMKAGIEHAIRQAVPEITGVEEVFTV